MTTFSDARTKLSTSRQQLETTRQTISAGRVALKRLDARIAELARTADPTLDAEQRRREIAVAQLADARTKLASAMATVESAHAAMVLAADPRRTLGELDDHVPFVLLPLRLETRFVGEELWIRAYPDEVAISSHEPALTDDEVARGKTYWTTVWGADDATVQAAWAKVYAGGPVARALWIVRALRPTGTPPTTPIFPVIHTKPDSWSEAPRVDVMPDQLVFTLLVNGSVAHQAIGARIPSPLIVGPDPSVAITRGTDGSLVLDPSIQWITDFERAVEIGMAVKIPLGTGPQSFDRLVVVGVKLASSASDGAAALQALIEAHRYGDGVQIVPQGMPTNHTEAASAGPSGEPPDQALARELGPALFTPTTDPLTQTDGARLASALGIADAALDHVLGADQRDAAEAVAMNRALWPATLGYFAEQLMKPSIDDPLREQARTLVTTFVRGRGGLAALMAGNQPYGVLATTAFSRWQTFAGEDPLLSKIDAALAELGTTWTSPVGRIARAGSGADPDAVLIDVLGLQASSVVYRARRLVGPEYLWNLASFQGTDPAPRHQAHQAASSALLASLGLAFAGGNPRILELELFASHFGLNRPAITDAPLSETRGLDPNYIEWLRGNLETIRNEAYGAPAPNTLLYLLLRQAILIGAWDASMRLLVAHGLAAESARSELELVNVRDMGEATRWDHLDAKIPGVSGTLSAGDFARTPQAGDASEEYREQLDALAVLSPLPTARLERLFAEHLDLCSYRLDAWRLGRVTQRLEAMRSKQRDGVYLGMYGWLENVQRRSKAEPTGFIHAPSLAHATTAAILRSGYDTHSDPDSRERMAIDLSSARVRRSLRYLEGVRQGQTLAALLGFRFERSLHDSNPSLALDQYVLALRQAFPLVANRIVQTGDPIDNLEATNVVDGTRLLQSRASGYPYGAAGLPDAGSPAGKAIAAAVDVLADDMDAIADVMLAESVYQAAQGKHERANAFATALVTGIPPSVPEVTAIPRSGTSVTHRICLVLNTADSTTSPWSASTPRARFEPQLDRWLGRVLGKPALIRMRVVTAAGPQEVGFDELAIQPIDLVCTCADASQALPTALARRIQERVRERGGLAADAPVELQWDTRDPSWSPSVRTLFEVMPLVASLAVAIQGRALGAGDLAAEGGASHHDTGELTTRLASAIADLGAAIASAPATREWLLGTPLADRAAASTAELAALHAQAASELARTSALTGQSQLDALVSLAKLLFGQQFPALPRFAPVNAAELQTANGAPSLLAGAAPFAVEEWLAGVGRVRPRAAAYENVLMHADLLGTAIERATVAQVPFDPAARWLGLDMASSSPRNGRALSLVLHEVGAFDPHAPQLGVVIDELVETIPNAAETTGIALHHDRPTSEPPQALLVVVPSALRGGWQWADLLSAVSDTLDLAKTRAVEPAMLATTGYAQFLPAVVGPVADNPVTITLPLQRLV